MSRLGTRLKGQERTRVDAEDSEKNMFFISPFSLLTEQ